MYKIFNRKVKRLFEENTKMLKNYDFTNLKSDITFVGLDDDMSFENEDLMQEIDDFFDNIMLIWLQIFISRLQMILKIWLAEHMSR